MIWLFIGALFLTLIVVRTWTHIFHDMKNYGTCNEKSRSFTCWLRKRTGFDFHHVHFGILIVIVLLPIFFFRGFENWSVVLLGVGLSFIADQITPLLDRTQNYFSKDKLMIAILFHVIIALIAIVVVRIF